MSYGSRSRRFLWWLAGLFGLLCALTAGAAPGSGGRDFGIEASGQTGKRVALVIGNATYPKSPLRNPVNDARGMSAKLRELGFDVISRENLTARQIGATMNAFRSRIRPGDEVLFFYAGHGLQVKGVNYLPAVDAEIDSEDDVPQQSINVANLLDLLEESKAGVKLIFLDACRNNPFSRGFRSASTGLSKVGNAPSGTLISFATRPGSVAADGTGSNGLYTEQLLRHIATPNVQVELMLKEVARDVENRSQSKQEPWIEGSIKGNFYFIFTGPTQVNIPAARPPAPVVKADPEEEAWNAAKGSNSAEAIQEYMNEYPKGRYASAAGILLAKLKAANHPPPPPPPVGYQVGQSFRDCTDGSCPELVVIPSGSFLMGSPEGEEGRRDDEGPQHRVTINYRLAVGKYEVTFGEWDACVAAGGCSHEPDDEGWGRGRRPVMRVSWHDTQEYVRWLSGKTGKAYRLLSEAEWEYAARAGTTTRYSFGDSASQLGEYVWHSNNSGIKTHPVGEKQPNAFGLFDMYGNVFEWVQDCWTDNYAGTPNDGSASNNCASNSRRVFRGGSWSGFPRALRSAYRGGSTPDSRINRGGFRVVRTHP